MRRFVPALICATLIAIGLIAGTWQMRRADTKLAMQAQLDAARNRAPVSLAAQPQDAAALEWRMLSVRGTWLADRTVFIDNKVHAGKAGFIVATPLRIEGGERCVLVLRGWVAGTGDRREPAVRTPEGVVEVVGEAHPPNPQHFTLGVAAPQGRIWQHLGVDEFAAATGLAMQPVLLQQTSTADDGLIREWGRPDLGVAKHHGYAFQWFSLAAATAVFFVFFSYRQRTRRADTPKS